MASDVVRQNTRFNKRVFSTDSSQNPISIVNPSIRVVQIDATGETEIIGSDITFTEVSTGLYSVDLTVDPSLFESDEVYHVVIEGQSSGISVDTELIQFSFRVERDISPFTVEFV